MKKWATYLTFIFLSLLLCSNSMARSFSFGLDDLKNLVTGEKDKTSVKQVSFSISYSDLLKTPEFWPRTVTILRDIKFNNGITLTKGQVVQVDTAKRDDLLEIHTGKSYRLVTKHDNTDFLERANDIYTKLNHDQRQVNYNNLNKYENNWPYYLEMESDQIFTGGEVIRAGEKVVLLGMDHNKIIVNYKREKYSIEAKSSSLLADVRQNIIKENMENRLFNELNESVYMPEGGDIKKINKRTEGKAKYYFIVGGTPGCSRVKASIPNISKLYEDTKSTNSNLDIIYIDINNDKKDLLRVVNNGVNWLVLDDAPLILQLLGREISGVMTPWIMIIDDKGKVIRKTENNQDIGDVIAFAQSIIHR